MGDWKSLEPHHEALAVVNRLAEHHYPPHQSTFLGICFIRLQSNWADTSIYNTIVFSFAHNCSKEREGPCYAARANTFKMRWVSLGYSG